MVSHICGVCCNLTFCFSPPWLNVLSWANRGSPRHLIWSEMCLCEEAQNTCFILFLSFYLYIKRIKPLRTSNIRLIIQKSWQLWHFGWSVKKTNQFCYASNIFEIYFACQSGCDAINPLPVQHQSGQCDPELSEFCRPSKNLLDFTLLRYWSPKSK